LKLSSQIWRQKSHASSMTCQVVGHAFLMAHAYKGEAFSFFACKQPIIGFACGPS